LTLDRAVSVAGPLAADAAGFFGFFGASVAGSDFAADSSTAVLAPDPDPSPVLSAPALPCVAELTKPPDDSSFISPDDTVDSPEVPDDELPEEPVVTAGVCTAPVGVEASADGADGDVPSAETLGVPVSGPSAHATPGAFATATPTPRATASPPTRPIYRA
jgi:hypothetical protein